MFGEIVGGFFGVEGKPESGLETEGHSPVPLKKAKRRKERAEMKAGRRSGLSHVARHTTHRDNAKRQRCVQFRGARKRLRTAFTGALETKEGERKPDRGRESRGSKNATYLGCDLGQLSL